MMIDIYKEVVEIFDEKIENTTKYNGQVYKLTELDEQGGHGDIIKYLEENKSVLF
jgi:hypothetical protein